MKYIKTVAMLVVVLPNILLAQQLKFSKQTTDNNVHFQYQWLDQLQQEQSLNFTLNKVSVFEKFRNFRSYHATLAEQYVDLTLRKSLIENPLPDVEISFVGFGDNAQIKLQGKSQIAIEQAYRTINQLEKKLMTEYLARNFYIQFLNFDNSIAIKPDHVKFAQNTVEDLSHLKTLILNNAPDQSVRSVSNYVLGFIQSIPYSTLESRVTSTGAGFNTPLQTLWENQGDCDSKVTLTAALFRALMPRIKMQLVFIDNHALLAINIEPENNELTIKVNGVEYVLAEPTGPAKMTLGKVSSDAEFAIRNGRYYAEAFFTNADN